MEKLNHILAVVEAAEAGAPQPSLEVLAFAQDLSRTAGARVSAAVLGESETSAAGYTGFQLSSLTAVVDPLLSSYSPEAWVEALRRLVAPSPPDLLVFGHSYQNMDMVPRLAACLGVPLVTDCINCRSDGQGLLFTRQMFRNKLNADLRVSGPQPWLMTLHGGAFDAGRAARGETALETFRPALEPDIRRRRVLERVGLERRKVDLAKAEIILGVGRGIRKKENLALVEELAAVLGAEIGASRPVVDSEWLERDRQIGSSGQTVSPKLYLALGISGAIQHVVGIRNSGCIVAVNSDPNAPIFNLSTYGIVGDVAEVVPALTRKLRESGR